jgi:hypothetical protein
MRLSFQDLLEYTYRLLIVGFVKIVFSKSQACPENERVSRVLLLKQPEEAIRFLFVAQREGRLGLIIKSFGGAYVIRVIFSEAIENFERLIVQSIGVKLEALREKVLREDRFSLSKGVRNQDEGQA